MSAELAASRRVVERWTASVRTLLARKVLCCFVVAMLGAAGFGAAPASAQPPQSQPWWLAQSGDLVFISQVPESRLRPLVLHLEALRRLVERTTTLMVRTPVPVYVYVFRDEGTQLPYRHRYDGEPALLSGAFYPGPHADFLTVAADQGLTTAGHEVLHSLLHSQLPGAPLWLEEGLAELYGAVALLDAKGDCGRKRPCDSATLRAELGRPVAAHVGVLRDMGSFIDIAGLAALDPESPEYHDFSSQQTYYARVWAFAHYLMFGPELRRRQAWELVAKGGASMTRQSVAQAFGLTPEELDAEVLHHVMHPLVRKKDDPPMPTWLPGEVDVHGPEIRLAVRRLPYDKLVTLLGELLAVEGRPLDAQDYFNLALRLNPKNSRALGGAGLTAERSNDWSRARAAYGDALRAAPDDPLLAFRYAVSLLVFGKATHPSKLAEARHHLTKATAARPRLAPVWAALLDAHELSGEAGDPDLVYARLRAADPGVALGLLLHYVRHGRGTSAEELIRRVISTDGPAEQTAARRAVDRLDWLRLGKVPETDLLQTDVLRSDHPRSE